jgi:hypothetical protein
MLSIVLLSVIILSVFILDDIMQSVIILIDIMLSIAYKLLNLMNVYPFFQHTGDLWYCGLLPFKVRSLRVLTLNEVQW